MRDIAYRDYNKRDDIHGTVLYPAVMIAPIQKEILSDLLDRNKRITVLDPFHGSGTALYEAAELSHNVHVTGCDINPLANLITKVKLKGVTNNIEHDIRYLTNTVSNIREIEVHFFPNIQKWFRADIILDLSKLRMAIKQIENQTNRLFFWYILIDIVRRYSNTRTSTYKLHTKTSDGIERIRNSVIPEYFASVYLNYPWFEKNYNAFSLIKGDSLAYLHGIDEGKFDISITSPPYGDNATTVPYGQFSMLSLYWIDQKDLELEGWEFDSYSSIDSRSLGGPRQSCSSELDFNLLDPYLSKISAKKQKKVIRFFEGYFDFLNQISRVTKSHIIMTLGNRTVDGVKIDLTDISTEYLMQTGFDEIDIGKREILSKRMPKKVSSVNSMPVSSMNEEYVIVLRKA